MDRPTKEVKLEVSGYTATVVLYFVRQEAKRVKNRRWDSQKFSNDPEDGFKVSDYNPAYVEEMDDETVRQATKKIVDSEGKELELNDDLLFGQLPNPDFEVLLKECNKAYTYDPEEGDKKKSQTSKKK